MIGHENNPQPREEKESPLYQRTKEIEQRALIGDDFDEGLHSVTSRGNDESLTCFRAAVMRWLDNRTEHNAQLVCANIEGLMNAARFMDSLDKASSEIAK